MSANPAILRIAIGALLLGFAHSERAMSADDINRIPIVAWWGPPASETTVRRYRELADAGFTHSYTYFPNESSQASALDIAQSNGISLLIQFPGLKKDPGKAALKFKNHRGLAGYFLMDEAGASQFPELANWVRAIKAVDPAHVCYINLFPNYADKKQLEVASYSEYVERFLRQVPVDLISFDHYPNVDGGIRPEWYENLETISAAARRSGKPFWAFVLSAAHARYGSPTLPEMRLQAFSNLAYGAQALQYFTYWAPKKPGESGNYHDTPIDYLGNRTATYDHVRLVNASVRALSRVFYGARVIRVMHAGPLLPRGTAAFRPVAPLRFLSTGGAPAVVSTLEKGGRLYLVLVNRALDSPIQVKLEFEPDNEIVEIDEHGDQRSINGSQAAATVLPGDVRLYSWSEKR